MDIFMCSFVFMDRKVDVTGLQRSESKNSDFEQLFKTF